MRVSEPLLGPEATCWDPFYLRTVLMLAGRGHPRGALCWWWGFCPAA